MNRMLKVIARGAFYASVLTRASGIQLASEEATKHFSQQLESAVPALYAAVILFSVKSYMFLSGKTFGKHNPHFTIDIDINVY